MRAAYSLDGGKTWAAFASEPPEGEGAGHITIAADGKRVIWTPEKAANAWITADFGKRWQKVKGVPRCAVIEADKVDEGIYYAFDGVTGKLYVSGNGGVEFKEVRGAASANVGDWFRPEIRPDPQRSAVVYLTASWRGLLRWSAGKLERLPGVEHADVAGAGQGEGRQRHADAVRVRARSMARAGCSVPTTTAATGSASTTTRIATAGSGASPAIRALYGRVYFAASGRGIVYGDPR